MTTIEIPGDLLGAARCTPEEAKLLLAKELFKQGRLNESQAMQLGGAAARLEKLFIKKDDADQIEMDQFISWAAHDFKSPLNAVIGFTKVVLKGIDGPVNEVQVTDLTSAHSSGQRMLTLTNNLIDMARLNTGEISLELNPGDLAQTIADACNRWKKQNPAKELDATIELNQADFNFDGARLRQVLNGLLTYAANHVAEGGKVTLRATEDAQNARVEITSSGEKARDKYEMDLRMIAFINRGLLRLHGGTLDLGEDSGSGLSLNFTLPKA
jgi:signal transduction histidine kinase